MTVQELLDGLTSTAVPPVPMAGLSCHSKELQPGDVFVAVRGARYDGHAFVGEAARRGACAVVVEHPPQERVACPVVVVDDTARLLPVMAARWCGLPAERLHVLGVTGTCGKTTTTYLIRAMLEADGRRTGLVGTVAYEIGVRHLPSVNTTPGPLMLQRLLAQMVHQGLDWCAMEISSHALDQNRVAGMHLDAAVWTCLGSDHLDYHKTLAHYAAAKRKIFSYLRSDGRAVINADDEEGRRLIDTLVPATVRRDQVVTFGVERPAMVSARLVRSDWSGMDLVMDTAWGTFPLRSQLVGRYNISNIAAATAAMLAVGVRVPAIQDALAGFPTVPGRLERVPNDSGIHVVVDFAHTADALRLVLLSLRELVRGRLIVVFGCGGDRDRTKRPVMGQLASLLADQVVLTSDNPRSEDPMAIIQDVKSGFVQGFSRFSVMPDRRQAILQALSMASADDAVLIAGKGHEAYQIFQHVTVPFSDRAVVEEYFTHTAHAVA